MATQTAAVEVSGVHRQIRRDFGFVAPPFALHDPAPPLLAGFWMACRESTLVGIVPRAHKEAVATAVSRLNACPYCVDAHLMMLHGTGAHDAAAALGAGRGLQDREIARVVQWASASRSPSAAILSQPPFGEEAVPELVGTVVTFHYVNRMVSALLPETPLPFRSERWKSPLRALMGRVFGFAIRRHKEPGAALSFLADAPLPSDLAWAERSDNVAGAFARWSAVVERAGRTVLCDEARAIITERVAAWKGEDPALGRGWVTEATVGLDARTRAEVAIGLVVALAPWQADAPLLDAYRATHPGVANLVGALAWSAFAAARRVGTWTAPSR
jgi:AhpD family alkylhydroperoxidase